MNYGHGKLSLEAFERRLEQALDAKQRSELSDLTNDLDLAVDASYIEKRSKSWVLNQRISTKMTLNTQSTSSAALREVAAGKLPEKHA